MPIAPVAKTAAAHQPEQTVLGVGTPSLPMPISQPAPNPTEYKFTFTTYVGDENDSVFKVAVSDQTITIRYNIHSRFYAEKILASDNGVQTKNILDATIQSSITAYIEVTDALSTLTSFADKLSSVLERTE